VIRIVALGEVAPEIIEPLLRPGEMFISEPTEADLAEADAAIVRAAYRVDEHALDAMPQVRVLARTGVGTDLVNLDVTRERGIPVVITPGSNTNAVAEGVFAHMLSLVKYLPDLDALVRDDRWNDRTTVPAADLDGKTLGIVGYGRIGKRVEKIARAFDMNVRAYDPIAEIPAEFRAETLAELLAASDIVTLHLPLTADTAFLINADSIDEMRPGAILINCSRGGLVDLDAAVRALDSGKLGGFGVDVFDPEPPMHHELFDHHRVSLSPHLMGFTQQAMIATVQDALRGIQKVFDGDQSVALA